MIIPYTAAQMMVRVFWLQHDQKSESLKFPRDGNRTCALEKVGGLRDLGKVLTVLFTTIH